MKPITLTLQTKPSRARNSKEDLLEQIVEATDGKNADKLRRALAIAVNTMKWTELDLTVLLKKKDDPKVRNFTALVWWSVKMKKV